MKIFIYALLCGPFALPALCDPTIAEQATITTGGSQAANRKIRSEARSLGRAVNIAVVDNGGNLLAFERMDGAFLAGIDLCQGKARSALRFAEPAAEIESTIHDGRYALMTMGVVEMQGGIPLLRGGSITGAIGVSGADSSTDAPIAEAAVKDLE